MWFSKSALCNWIHPKSILEKTGLADPNLHKENTRWGLEPMWELGSDQRFTIAQVHVYPSSKSGALLLYLQSLGSPWWRVQSYSGQCKYVLPPTLWPTLLGGSFFRHGFLSFPSLTCSAPMSLHGWTFCMAELCGQIWGDPCEKRYHINLLTLEVVGSGTVAGTQRFLLRSVMAAPNEVTQPYVHEDLSHLFPTEVF